MTEAPPWAGQPGTVKYSRYIRKILNKSPSIAEDHPFIRHRGMPPIAYADLVLGDRIAIIRGVVHLDGKAAVPLVRLRAANRVLKDGGFDQIEKDPAWIVE